MKIELIIAVLTMLLLFAMFARCWVNWKRSDGKFWATVWKTGWEVFKVLGTVLGVIFALGVIVAQFTSAYALEPRFIPIFFYYLVLWSFVVSFLCALLVHAIRSVARRRAGYVHGFSSRAL
jgi:predicted neutral ceramidase superfamily lipid hydrolase